MRRVASTLAITAVVLLALVSMVNSVFAEEDVDGDGLQDWWELQYFGDLSQEAGGDFDGDGFTNLEEHDAGSDPVDPNDGPRPPADNRL